MSKRQFIAIDGGGTKTEVAWFDESGEVINRVTGKAANPNGLSLKDVRHHLQAIFQELFAGKNDLSNLHNVFGGFAGGSHPQVQNKLRAILTELLPSGLEIKIDHDAINALWSGTHGEPGLVLVAGTGSVVYGMNDAETGETFRVGGWGYLIGDEGSGYDIGRMAARAVMMAFDGRGPKTVLTQSVLTYFKKEKESDLIPLIYEAGKSSLSNLVPLIAEAVQQGDRVAQKILDLAAHRLATLVITGFSHFKKRPTEFVFVGGLHHLRGHLLTPLKNQIDIMLESDSESKSECFFNLDKNSSAHSGLKQSATPEAKLETKSEFKPELRIVLPDVPPVYGAAVECLRMAGLKPNSMLLQGFK